MKKAVLAFLFLTAINPCLARPRMSLAGARYSGGTGTADDPYQIATAEDLNDIGNHTEDFNKCFVQTADINLAQFTGSQFKIIGNSSTPFTGVFDGSGYAIQKFSYEANSDCTGLFGVVSGHIRNVFMIEPNLNAGTGKYVGALSGSVINGDIVNCCIENGYIFTDGNYVGGLIGRFYGSGELRKCYIRANVNGNDIVGGLAGEILTYQVSDCLVEGNITGRSNYVGGFAGNNNSNIINCGVYGNISGLDVVGGLIGYNTGVLRTSRFVGNVAGANNVGGITGYHDYYSVWTHSPGLIDCYAEGEILGISYIGGLVGYHVRSVLLNSYSACKITGNSRVGGLVGITSDCYSGLTRASVWDIEKSRLNSYSGNCYPSLSGGKTTEQMKFAFTFRDWACDANWIIDDGIGPPRLYWENQPGQTIMDTIYKQGTGNPDDPILIQEPQQLLALGRIPCLFDKSFKLVNDLNLVDYNLYYILPEDANIYDNKLIHFPPIGIYNNDIIIAPFKGIFDGDGHIISDFTFNSIPPDSISIDAYAGLFGYVDSNAQIKNLGMIRPNIISLRGLDGGTIVSRLNSGTVSNCFSLDGRVVNTGGGRTGGLVGRLGSLNARILDSYSTTNVSGTTYVGGLAGYNYGGTIQRCYSAGNVAGASYIGGFIGAGSGTVTDSFWDVDTSGQSTSAGGTGLTTEQMKTYATYADADWDFNNVWHICEGTNYPKLQWQIPLADFLCPDGVDFIDYSFLAEHWRQTDYGNCNGFDITGNGKVDLGEFTLLADYWRKGDCGNCAGIDYSGDSKVDSDDLAILCENWLATDYGDVGGAEITADGQVNLDDLGVFAGQWLTGLSY